eukprot:15451752-Alexandrium_andersonii.AAC.1
MRSSANMRQKTAGCRLVSSRIQPDKMAVSTSMENGHPWGIEQVRPWGRPMESAYEPLTTRLSMKTAYGVKTSAGRPRRARAA